MAGSYESNVAHGAEDHCSLCGAAQADPRRLGMDVFGELYRIYLLDGRRRRRRDNRGDHRSSCQ